MSADITQQIVDFINQHNVWLKRLASLVLVLFALLLASKLVSIIYLFLPQYQTQTVSQSNQSLSNTSQSSVALSKELASSHLFGEYVEVVEQELVLAEDAPETTLRLELMGVWADPVPEMSSAVIAEKGKSNQLVYFVEDELPGDAILKQVLADKVIIERAGQLETLRFEDAEESGSSVARNGSSSNGGSSRDDVEREPVRKIPTNKRLSSANGAANSIERYTSELGTLPPRQLFDRVQDALKEDPESFIENVGLVASSEGGYEVSQLVPPEVAKAYGLEPGDRIISVNGKSVGNPAEDANILDEIKSNGEATIQIQRGRSITTVSLPILF